MMKCPKEIADNYHKWYFEQEIQTTWRGILSLKSVSDMWNYQEIITKINASLIIEFGVYHGGSTLFFSDLLKSLGGKRKVLAVDTVRDNTSMLIRTNENIELLICSSTDQKVAIRIIELRKEYPGSIFTILDSNHTKEHVLAEMESLRPVLIKGDYLIVEDSNLGNHPVCEHFGDNCPFKAREEYFNRYPNDYEYDVEREERFGFTYSVNGFLRRL